LLVARGQTAPRLGGLPPDAVVIDVADLKGAGTSWDAVLVAGTTADVTAAVVGLPPGFPIAFAHAPELCRLFAVDPGLDAALQRAGRGEKYPVDLGWIDLAGTRHPFLGTITSGAGAQWRRGFPWAGRSGAVAAQVDGGRSRSARARALTVSNLQHWGDWTLSPRSAPNDGQVEIQSFTGKLGQLLRVRRLLRSGTHGGDDGVRRSRGAEAAVQVPSQWRVVADGNTVGRGAFTVSVQQHRATLLI
jgi:diacylglycerol kinase family enzyme